MLKTILLVLGLLVVLGGAYIAYSWWRFSGAIDAEIAALLAAAEPTTERVTGERLAALPAPVARHLRQAGVVGQQIPRIVELTQTGRIRSSQDAGWMELEAKEVYSTNPPAFIWRAYFPTQAMHVVFGRDHYLAGDGAITMKALGVLPVATIGGGAEMNHAGLMRYLNEIMWFPAAYAASNLTWREIDDTSAEVSLTDQGITATARLEFDAAGRLVNFIAKRFNTGTNSVETWETPMQAYATFNGVTLPSRGSAVFQLDDGPFTYAELDVTSVIYDPPETD